TITRFASGASLPESSARWTEPAAKKTVSPTTSIGVRPTIGISPTEWEVAMRQTSTKAAAVLIVAFGLTTLATMTGSAAQPTELAYATAPRNDYVVFLDQGDTLSPSALKTVDMAARRARQADIIVRLSGSPERTVAVKAALVREGVPSGTIEV